MHKTTENSGTTFQQVVKFSGSSEQQTVEISQADVKIIPSPGDHNHGSSKVKLKNIVDFTWEHKYHAGQLLAVHVSGKYLAYGIKASNGNGVVRVVNKDTEQRTLIRGMHGLIQDLSFAHVQNPILAYVDSTGSLFVYSIEATKSGELICNRILQVDADDSYSTCHRVIWCPYIPEEDATDGEEVSKLLVLTRGSIAELWSVATASNCFPDPIKANDPEIHKNNVMVEINAHNGLIVEATFSPDGTALATASYDGDVKFFQVHMLGSSPQQPPKCLHQWTPHEGRPISSLFFLDDHKNYNPDAQFWRFAVTGCNFNSEIKIWSCELWQCLQTITIAPSPMSSKSPVLKASLDLAGGYLLLSDVFNKVLYIFSISKDSKEAVACINTVSEFLLPYPILSFAIVDAAQRHVRPTGSLEDLCPGEDENEDQLVIRMYLVQPKSLQECHIAFKSPISGTCLMDTLTHDSLDYTENIPEIAKMNDDIDDESVNEMSLGVIMDKVNTSDEEMENGDDNKMDEELELNEDQNAGLNLMTPEAFSSPAKKDTVLDSKSSSPQLGNIESASPSIAQTVQALNAADQPLATSKLEEVFPSGGSSPSREVREILSLSEPEESEPEVKTEPMANTINENWAQVPMCKLTNAFHAMHEQEQQDIADGQISIKKDLSPSVVQKEVIDTKWKDLSNDMHAITKKLDTMLELIQDQQQEISELRHEARLRQEVSLVKRVESILTKALEQQTNSIIASLLNQNTSRQRDFQKHIEDIVKKSIETAIPASIHNVVEPLKRQLRVDANQIESIVKDNLNKAMNGPQMREALSKTATNAAKPALENAFRETFEGMLLPAFEKACQTMFKQVQDTFVQGTKEYIQNVDTHIDSQYQRHNKLQSDLLATTIREQMQNEFSRGLSAMQENTVRSVRDSVKENFTQHMSNLSGISSRATTPGLPTPSPVDNQARVMSLLQRGQINSAFQQALSASDLGLVVLVCESTDPARVFSVSVGSGQTTRCMLQQPVLLSLVQQLAANLGHRTELKHRWLEEAVISLDPSDPITREHMTSVLLSLQNQIQLFIAANPGNRSVRRLKMVAMAAQSLLKAS
ncbi:hypothetical protein TKK_0005001 [Trichogramma kaykai]|uniref:Enhancer of mRNA-decapping protein 4 WD40 repeat region domain-containing protein n=1 Tax=Trichogramma kaykai TaxID=54128 RepID=A0ABD2XJ36_9HYME